jgi:hypothetical protein
MPGIVTYRTFGFGARTTARLVPSARARRSQIQQEARRRVDSTIAGQVQRDERAVRWRSVTVLLIVQLLMHQICL